MRLIALLILLSSPSILAQTKKKIILSYFEPFAGREDNHTEAVAKLVKEKMGKDVELVLCPLKGEKGLPVAFHSGRTDIIQLDKTGKLEGASSFDGLKACLDEHPDAQQVLSLGEGSCRVEVEGVARNLMTTGYSSLNKDNNGVMIPTPESIAEKGPKGLPTEDANILALCIEQNITNVDQVMSYSTDAGLYVCNNLMYNFQSYLEYNKLPVSYAFIHIPLPYEGHKGFCNNGLEVGSARAFSSNIADQVASFIKSKSRVLNDILPKDNGQSTLKEICAHPGMDTVPSLDIPAGAVSQLKALKDSEILQATPIKDCIRRFKVIQKSTLYNL